MTAPVCLKLFVICQAMLCWVCAGERGTAVAFDSLSKLCVSLAFLPLRYCLYVAKLRTRSYYVWHCTFTNSSESPACENLQPRALYLYILHIFLTFYLL